MITDHAMPGMTGSDLARAIAAAFPGLPIVLATGYADLPAGADARLQRLSKPYRQEALSEAIDEALDPRREEPRRR